MSRLARFPQTLPGLLLITALYAPFGHMAVKLGTADLGSLRQAGHPPDPAGSTLLPVLVFLVATGFVLWRSNYWRWWIFWRPPMPAVPLAKWQLAVRSLLAVVLLTECFAIATALIYVYARGVFEPTSELTEVLWPLERHYAWHLANAVPALEPSETFGVSSPVEFRDPWSGLLLVAYKLFVIAPLITIGRVLVRRRESRQVLTPAPA